MGIRGTLYAVEAGSCAAMASVCAKLAVSSDAISKFLGAWIANSADNVAESGLALQLTVVLRVAAVAGIFLFNALMWVLFTKSMHICSSTLEATIFNTASNFFFTAVVGKLLFGEHLGLQWCLGSALLIVGLTVLHDDSKRYEDHKLGNVGAQKQENAIDTDQLSGSKKDKIS